MVKHYQLTSLLLLLAGIRQLAQTFALQNKNNAVKFPKKKNSSRKFVKTQRKDTRKKKKKENGYKKLKFNETNTTLIVYSNQGYGAVTISAEKSSQEILKKTLIEALSESLSFPTSDRRKLKTTVSSVSFENAKEAFPGSGFTKLTYSFEVDVPDTKKNLMKIQKNIDTLASNGTLTELVSQLDQSSMYGFSIIASTVSALYKIKLRFEHECTETLAELGNGMVKALKRYHEHINDEFEQGLSDFGIVDLVVTSEKCENATTRNLRALDERHGRAMESTGFSFIEYFFAVGCSGKCPSKVIPLDPIDNYEVNVNEEYSYINEEDELITFIEQETGVVVDEIRTNKIENGIVGCFESDNEKVKAKGICTYSPSESPSVKPPISHPQSETPSISFSQAPSESPTITVSSLPSESPVITPTVSSSPSATLSVSPTAPPTLSPLNQQWLDAHNKRRLHWHVNVYNLTYVPLEWNEVLAVKAQIYADKLLAEATKCGAGWTHAEGKYKYGGENLAWSTSSINSTPENVLVRWADNEANLEYDDKKHFTAILWRATRYLGCGVASREKCHYQICRYVATPNCNMNADNWLERVQADTSPCKPQVPCAAVDEDGQCLPS